jgi:hypothetical protein
MTRMVTALGAVLILAGSAAATAPAKPGAVAAGSQPAAGVIQESSATAQASGDGSTATATAICPQGTKAAGGGFDAPSSVDAVALVYESVKVHQHAWRASVQLLDPGDRSTLTLTTYAYCRPHLPATHTAETTVPTTGSVQMGPTASATCPHNAVALAGGFHMPPPLVSPTVTALFFDSLRSGDSGWDAQVFTGPAGPSSLTGEAYCARSVDAPAEADGTSAPNSLDSTISTATATCPAGLGPAAGGFSQPESGVVSFFFVDSSRRVGDRWQVSGFHSGGAPAVALNSAAYCS